MKILIDTNILISAALNPAGVPFRAYVKAVTYPNSAVVCEQNIEEMVRVFNRKFPNKLYALNNFLSLALTVIEIVPVPEASEDSEANIRDMMDRPILRAAINAGVDVILTGDKDFLESGINNPQTITASDFLKFK